MKQKIYIAALLAGMLALAGCGGGSDAVNDDENGDNQNMVNTFDASDCKAGTKVNDAGDGCIADTSIADQTKKEADYLALFNALNGPVLGAANISNVADQTSFTDKTPAEDNAIQYYSMEDAEDQDNHKSASISAQGAKFSSLVADDENDITDISDDDKTITLNATVAKDNVEFTGVSTGQQNAHAKTSTYDTDGDSDTDPVIAFSASGKYRGVSGTYYCTGVACTSSVNNGGMLMFAGTWVFVAGSKDAQLMVDDAVTYGWWTNTASAPGSVLQAGLFTDREDGVDATYEDTRGGSATYKGEALGQYVMSADNFGAFTADATLTADFTGTNTLEGMINGFKDADGGDLTGWEVKLGKTNIQVNGTFVDPPLAPAASAGKATWSIGDKKGAAGNWQGALYGGTTTKYPTHAAGEFSAHHGPTGRMIGAFGAELESN